MVCDRYLDNVDFDPDECNCQTCRDYMKSLKITKAHVQGKRCVNHNQCTHCCYIDHLARVVRHFSGACSQNTKCPVCYWLSRPNEAFNAKCEEKRIERRIIQRQLIYEALGIGYDKVPWKYRG